MRRGWERSREVYNVSGKYVPAIFYRKGTFEIVKPKRSSVWSIYDGERHLGNEYTLKASMDLAERSMGMEDKQVASEQMEAARQAKSYVEKAAAILYEAGLTEIAYVLPGHDGGPDTAILTIKKLGKNSQ